ncbi:hypothetical protein HDU98_009965 [Podochytrium sp. JEL0797]|nr:hypothetical protein HDU98_009965 [Podochytrium sp. JEL0797]
MNHLKTKDFSSKSFWDSRFEDETNFEWLTGADTLAQHVASLLATQQHFNRDTTTLLHIGSGTSTLSNSLRSLLVPNYLSSPALITNLDYSPLAVQKGKEIERDQFESIQMRWCVADLLNWESLQESLRAIHPTAEFIKYSMIVEKSCADAISCGHNVISSSPLQIPESNARNCVAPTVALAFHLARVTNAGARWIALSYSKYRFDFLDPDSDEYSQEARQLWRVVEMREVEPESSVRGADEGVENGRGVTATSILLNNGLRIPSIGLGVYKASPEDCYKTVLAALHAGYRHIDTASIYKNEADVGRAIKESGIPRKDIWITTKLNIADMRSPRKAFETSLALLQTDYVDLYLIHAPIHGKRLSAWKEMELLFKEGHAKSIGVSNFNVQHLQELLDNSTVVPAVNQIELNPFLQHADITEFCKQKGITVQAYSPLTKARKLDDPVLVQVSTRLQKSPAQVLIRWGLQKGYVSLPKTVNPTRLVENLSVFDWAISDKDMVLLDGLECNFVTEWDPTQWGSKDASWGQWGLEKVIHTFIA